MTHLHSLYIAIALEAAHQRLGWSRGDVVKYCLADIARKSLGMAA